MSARDEPRRHADEPSRRRTRRPSTIDLSAPELAYLLGRDSTISYSEGAARSSAARPSSSPAPADRSDQRSSANSIDSNRRRSSSSIETSRCYTPCSSICTGTGCSRTTGRSSPTSATARRCTGSWPRCSPMRSSTSRRTSTSPCSSATRSRRCARTFSGRGNVAAASVSAGVRRLVQRLDRQGSPADVGARHHEATRGDDRVLTRKREDPPRVRSLRQCARQPRVAPR